MWSSFFFAVAVGAAILYLPGYFMAKSLRLSSFSALMVAPLVTVAVYEILAILYSKVGMSCSWITLSVPLFGAGILLYVASGLFRKSLSHKARGSKGEGSRIAENAILAIAYLSVSVVVALVFFVLPLDGPLSFNQDHDNVHHLNLIRAFVNSGDYSPLTAGWCYQDSIVSPYLSVGGFYPAAWHAVNALLVDFMDVPIPISVNAINFLVIAVVFPLSVCFLNKTLFPENRLIQLCGAFVALAFAAFPWNFLTFGPLYPNLFGMSLLPASVALFVRLIEREKISGAFRDSLLFLLSLVSLAFAHTNSVFSLAIILIPYCIYCILAGRGIVGFIPELTFRKKLLFSIAFMALVLVAWSVLQRISFLQAVVSFRWPSYAAPEQELINIIVLAYKEPFAQIVLSVVLLVGLVTSLSRKRQEWLVASYVLSCVLVFVSATSDGFLKGFLTGFWYTDPVRLAANAVLVAIPLSSIGLASLVEKIGNVLPDSLRCFVPSSSGKVFVPAAAVICSLFVIVNCYPNYQLPGRYYVHTAFGSIEEKLYEINNATRSNLLSPEEKDFLDEVKGIVGDSLVVNSPEDGSFFGYALDDLNVYYRSAGLRDFSNQTAESDSIRLELDELAEDEGVKEAVDSTGAKYVLLLDQGGAITADRHTYGYYNPDEWSGLNAISDETPGLSLILSEGDMRLYEIRVN